VSGGRPAILFDRDGTLAHEVGYVNHVSRFALYPFAAEAVRAANRAGFLVAIITNQAGVARGYFPEPLVLEVHARMREAIEGAGARLDAVYYCPHHPAAGAPPYRQACDCRKPRPGMARRAEAELGADLSRSWVGGDRFSDLEVAWAVGARAALVKTGYGLGELAYGSPAWRRQPDLVATHALEAVQEIVARAGKEPA
jgi:D-glycero-D-manno-heptose 1,7-bisphosphate phosphatase